MTPTAQQSSAPAPSMPAGPLTGAPAPTATRRPAGPRPARPLTETARGLSDRIAGHGSARERASTAPGGRPCSV
ncbi:MULTISPECIES: hypothetical protein [Streptomyces]|uniref:hypothetical protein n=1 Tax=Streptomyces TaxID=1883 RepID=UPI001678F269|nr:MULTISPECIES: hypothetical protein [Streptomyces]MBK3527914.1 hypothetical protein [Streptomyces sp. MBT70]GGR65185.1 hypothetical protein GCM10010236_18660 [Streptomyces eurythermus]